VSENQYEGLFSERLRFIANVREYANWLEAHPGVPTPTGGLFPITWLGTIEQVRKATHLSGDWTKRYIEGQVCYQRAFDQDIDVTLYVARDQVCTKVQTGTRHVPAVPEHDEPVYEWKCVD
jgi:hypothetical protein